jgi:hypothetical protein
MTKLRTAATTIAAAAALILVGAPSAQAAPATRHHGHFWVWFGPRSWDAVYGTYGITVSSPSGNDVLDLGFSSTLCSAGATYAKSVKHHFAAQRTQLRQNGLNITDASQIVRPGGATKDYRRQVLNVKFSRHGTRFTGVITLDYDFQENVDGVNYCYARNLAKSAPSSRWTDTRHTLNSIHQSLAYSGPGVPKQDPTM